MERQPLISPDGHWWWDGRLWQPIGGRHTVIPIQRRVPLRYARDVEPPEIRARFGAAMLAIGFALTLPGAFVGTIFSMAIATGQASLWPTLGEGAFFYLLVLGFFGVWPMIGFIAGFGLRDASRWILLTLSLSGAAPGLFLGGLMVMGEPGAPGSDLVQVETAVGWMWAIPALGLLLLRGVGVGRRLPPLRAFLRMFGSHWREALPGVRTEPGELIGNIASRYRLRVPGADFALPVEAEAAILAAGGRARVTYDLRRGRIETIDVGAEN